MNYRVELRIHSWLSWQATITYSIGDPTWVATIPVFAQHPDADVYASVLRMFKGVIETRVVAVPDPPTFSWHALQGLVPVKGQDKQ